MATTTAQVSSAVLAVEGLLSCHSLAASCLPNYTLGGSGVKARSAYACQVQALFVPCADLRITAQERLVLACRRMRRGSCSSWSILAFVFTCCKAHNPQGKFPQPVCWRAAHVPKVST